MLKETFKNNILYLLKEKNKTIKDLQEILEMDEIPLYGMLDGEINHSIREMKKLGEFFGIEFQTLYQPLTEEKFDLFENEEERNEFKQKLFKWQEAKCNETSSFMNVKWEKRREFKPKK